MKSSGNLRWFVPAVILLSLVVCYPILRTVILSFTRDDLATGFHTHFAGLDNFQRILFDSRLRTSLWTTVFFTLVSVGVEFILGLLLALSMESVTRWRSLYRVVFLIPWTLPTAVIALLWGWIFHDQLGVLNTVLVRIGILHAPIAWLARPATAMAAIIVADVWKTTPFVFLILLAGLQNIPRELYEAIEIDGGGIWARFRYVTWPNLLPFVFVTLVFRIVQAFAIFDLVWVMTGGGPGGATETLSIYTYRTYMRYLDFGYGSALAVATVAALALIAGGLYRLLVTRYEDKTV